MKRDRNIQDEQKKEFRRRLRRRNTKAEYVLWQELRASKRDWKFRRQVGIGKFIVDFYCHELRLIIELDGPIHQYQKEYDRRRQSWLESRGYIVIRFLNDEILFERDIALQCIDDWCEMLSEAC